MPDEPSASAAPEPEAAPPSETKRPPRRRASESTAKASAPESAAPPSSKKSAEKPMEKPAEAGPRVPKQATLSERDRRLLVARRALDGRRPVFGRQAENRYERVGRDGSWRRPRGLQSKQRRHYGYRARVVRVGYRSPAAVRGLVPSGFKPVLVRTTSDLERVQPTREAAVIARTVGTRRRLALEEAARERGIRVLNPIVKSEAET